MLVVEKQMTKRHIAFIVESAHGHINSTLGITKELVQRGFRVSYCVKDYFASRVKESGAEAFVYKPLENKLKVFKNVETNRGNRYLIDLKKVNDDVYAKQLAQEEIEDTLRQLENIYRNDKPDLIIYDKTNWAGKLLALKWNISKIEHWPMVVVETDLDDHPFDENLVLVSVPDFFQPNASHLDKRFQLINPTIIKRKFLEPWNPKPDAQKIILVSSTTGLPPQIDFFKTAIRALENLPYQIILSIGDDIDARSFPDLPENFEINRKSSHLDFLKYAVLYVGQGGHGSVFEALYCGVPMILIPPSVVHDWAAIRVMDLSLGIRIPHPEAVPEKLRTSVISVLGDQVILSRVRQCQALMHASNGSQKAADLIDRHLFERR